MTNPGSADLSASELERYSRQVCLPEIGEAGQLKLKHARALIIGAGGLGTPLAAYLVAAGVGYVRLVEHDAVALSNLQRQILYTPQDVDRPKAWTAKARLEALNPHVHVSAIEEALTPENAERLLLGFDLIADCSDNFATRYLINDTAWKLGTPVIHASVHRFEGQVTVLIPGKGPCYRCLYPEPPAVAAHCGDAGVLGVLPGILGLLQATEVLKLLLGLGEPLVGRVLVVEALGMRFTEIGASPDAACRLCGAGTGPDLPLARPPAEGEEDLEIPPAELARLSGVRLLDVREGSVAELAGARRLPVSRLAAELATLNPSESYVVCCEHGTISRYVAAVLRGAGIRRAWSLRGGLQPLAERGPIVLGPVEVPE
ncbi:putative adenylyltransferase/sulfurtransferase MoeZ [compost metagenome]